MIFTFIFTLEQLQIDEIIVWRLKSTTEKLIADADALKCRIWRDGEVHMRQKSLTASAGHKVSVCERPCGKWTQCVPRLYRAGFRGRLALLLQEVTKEFTSIHLAIDWPQILIAPRINPLVHFAAAPFYSWPSHVSVVHIGYTWNISSFRQKGFFFLHII